MHKEQDRAPEITEMGIEKLKKEHSVYKEFFNAFMNRPRNVWPVVKIDYLKSKALDVLEKLNS